MPGSRKSPLHGLRILDLATIVAGPMASTLLADYGATVVKVELPGGGDGARRFPPMKEGKPLWWKVVNRNKRFITLDLRTEKGRDILLGLLPRFDVVVENFRPGTLDRWGLDKETMWRANPDLTILRVTGFGQDGPYSTRPGFARIFEAMSGLTYVTGEADGEPMHSGYPIGDAVGGIFGALSVMVALWDRARHPGEGGREIDLSLVEASLRVLDFLPIQYDQLGMVHERMGNMNQYSAPSTMLKSSDGHWFTLAGSTDAIFARNCAAIGQVELARDARFSDNARRVEHAEELNRIFKAACLEMTADEISGRFAEAGGTAARVMSSVDIAEDPHFIARKALVDAEDRDFGSVKMPCIVPRFSGYVPPRPHSAGDLGQDNADVFGELLGLEGEDIRTLRTDGII